jgi:hypothetical protein
MHTFKKTDRTHAIRFIEVPLAPVHSNVRQLVIWPIKLRTIKSGNFYLKATSLQKQPIKLYNVCKPMLLMVHTILILQKKEVALLQPLTHY